jgi:hypothetical protein
MTKKLPTPIPARRAPLATYEIRIIHFEQFAQGGTKNRVKKRTFLRIFAKKARIFANFCDFLPIFSHCSQKTCAFGAKI